MAEKIGFFTPVIYQQPTSFGQKIISAVDSYFYFGGKKAMVIDPKAFEGKIFVGLQEGKESTLRIALKLASYVLFALPMLIVKAVIRLTHHYKIMPPHKLVGKVDKIVESNNPPESAVQKTRKKEILTSAYAIAMFELQRSENVTKPNRELAFTIGEILTRYAILHYGDEALPGQGFEIAQQILFGALNAQLYSLGIIDSCFDFTKAESKRLGRSGHEKSFQTMEGTFCGLDTDAILRKLTEAPLTNEQKILLSKTLRYINGVQRYLIWRGKREPNPYEVTFFKKLLDLAEKTVLMGAKDKDEEKDKEILRELWEMRYNDFPYYYEKGIKDESRLKANWEWLYKTCELMPKTYIYDICRVANKSAKSVEDYQAAWFHAKAALRQSLKDAETGAYLENIMERLVFDEKAIAHVTQKLMELDFELSGLQMAWFAMLPSNMAAFLMRENPRDIERAKPLLYLSKAIVDRYEAANFRLYQFKAIKRNFDLYFLLSFADAMQKTLKEELDKTAKAPDLMVSIIQLRNHLKEVAKPLEHLSSEDYKKERETIQHLQKELEAYKEKEPKPIGHKVKELLQIGYDLSVSLFDKGTKELK